MTRTYLTAVLAVALSVVSLPAFGAIILPGIQGTVFQDTDLSGLPSPGEGVSGATLRLYQDDGDGVFEPGGDDAQVGSDFVTGTGGGYAFEALNSSASYFVQRADLNFGGGFLPAAVSGLLTPGQIGLLIDSFSTNQAVTASPSTPIGTSTLSDPISPVIGHERDLFVHKLDGVGEVELRSNAFGVEVLQYDTTAGVVGQGVVTWDGIDMSANPVPSLGLGDVDLTGGGVNEGLLMLLGVDATGASETVRIRIFDQSNSEYSEAAIAIPVTDGTATAMAYLPFSDFVGSVSPNKVNAIQLILGEGAKSIDAQVDLIGAIAPVRQDFVVVPEPSAFAIILLGIISLLFVCRRAG
jgi:hypothetical protein